MAVDTTQKRASAIWVLSPFRQPLILPASPIGQATQQQIAFLYSGILAAAPAINPVTAFAGLLTINDRWNAVVRNA